MAKRHLPTPEELRQLVRYEPETGKLFWRERSPEAFMRDQKYGDACKTWNSQHAGREIVNVSRMGYIRVGLGDRYYMGHRVAWCLAFGKWPENFIDHINGDKLDNRLGNLRDVTAVENQRNSKRPKHNTSGYAGVGWHKKSQKWRAYVQDHGKHVHLGFFDSKEEAAAVTAKKRADLGFTKRYRA